MIGHICRIMATTLTGMEERRSFFTILRFGTDSIHGGAIMDIRRGGGKVAIMAAELGILRRSAPLRGPDGEETLS